MDYRLQMIPQLAVSGNLALEQPRCFTLSSRCPQETIPNTANQQHWCRCRQGMPECISQCSATRLMPNLSSYTQGTIFPLHHCLAPFITVCPDTGLGKEIITMIIQLSICSVHSPPPCFGVGPHFLVFCRIFFITKGWSIPENYIMLIIRNFGN